MMMLHVDLDFINLFSIIFITSGIFNLNKYKH